MASHSTDDPAPRRSTRISSQSKPEEKAAPAAKKPARKTATKRAAEGSGKDDEKGKNKKAKGDDGEASEGDPSTMKDPGPAAEASSPVDAQALPRIDIGDSLPSVTLKNEKGEDVDVGSLTSTNGVVFFLVPRADTPGCTNQACGFRDIWKEFTDLHFDVYCLSADTPTAQSKWQTKKELPYSLLSDPKRILIGALGAADGNKTKRSHFVFEAGGKLVDKKMPVKPVDSPRLALEFIKSIA
ncbi:thioredoxin-like protein [Leucogyrophana mollusca]|uniref:Thioredoxin-like protein n=1 Tax=Leucogyrophana mollusca TaxID=85980 RepID=A0ACB8BV97_9AGAM|nr:thioredoxin-like protein [Leucogyrophana mollusca]